MKPRHLLLIAATLAAGAMPASAHAFLEKASPAAGQNLNAAPAKVDLHFSEALEPAFSGATVKDSGGNDMAAGPAIVGGAEVTVSLKKLAPGRYQVSWHAVALDTHRSEGSYNFMVVPNASPASSNTTPPVIVTDAWIRALPAGLPDSGYFTMKNPAAKAVTLTGASSSACGMLSLHKSQTMSGMSSMSDVESIDVPAGATVKFAPGGYHLMCMSPAATIKPGGKVTVVLEIADGTKMPVEFTVRGANGR